MGVFDFIKSAGEKIFDLNPTQKAAEILAERIRKFRLGGNDIKVEQDGDRVKVSGSAATQAEREKIVLAIGNVAGVAQVEEDLKVSEASAAPAQLYTVVKGDTLSKISKQFYGSAQRYNRIFEANRPLLTHPDKIYPGQVLRIPPAN